jgi:formylglycine-generating enzyme required for sulfatase activity
VKRLLLASLSLLCATLTLPLAGADKLKGKKVSAKAITNSIGMKLVRIPSGKFPMGSPKDEERRAADEGPRHEVQISRAFYLGVFPVTQGQYRKVMGKNPSWFSAGGAGRDKVKGLDTDSFPAENVSWHDAVKFCKRLSALAEEKKARRVYRLPTEAEWEYACRAGTSTPFHFGKSASSRQANFNGRYPYGGAEKGPELGRTCKVGSYKPNAWGLYDMHGNVYQWCADWYGKGSYAKSDKEDPKGPTTGSNRVLRGGCCFLFGRHCRAAARASRAPGSLDGAVGFRVVCDVPKKP